MAWDVVFGYRMRFNVTTGTGDLIINHRDSGGAVHSTPVQGLTADRFSALAVLLRLDKDHKIVFDGTMIDAGPEAP
jgi:hypothetical protein